DGSARLVGPHHRISGPLLLAVCVAVAPAGCRRRAKTVPPVASAVPKPPVDHLGPGELEPGTEAMNGLVLPRGMRVAAQCPGAAQATGPLNAEDVANYIRDRVDVRRIELGVVGTVFNAVHVNGGDPNRIYRIEVSSAGPTTELVMRDVTPVPPKLPEPN